MRPLRVCIAALLILAACGPVAFAQGPCNGPIVQHEGGTSLDGVVAVRIDHSGGMGDATVCLTDADGVVRASRTVRLDGPGIQRLEFAVPAARHVAVVETASGTVGGSVDPRDCPSRAQEATFVVTQGSVASGGRTCFEPKATPGPIGPPLPGEWPTWTVLGGAAAALLVAGGLVSRKLRFLALALFTRLRQSRLLQQQARSRIAELVHHEPGIHAAAIARRLGLGRGTTDYHLAVLERERLVVRFATRGAVHWFEPGRFTPAVMLGVSTLRRPACRQAFLAIRERPGIAAGDLARHLGVSASAGSKATRKLREAGLVAGRAHRAGTSFHPTLASRDLPPTALRD